MNIQPYSHFMLPRGAILEVIDFYLQSWLFQKLGHRNGFHLWNWRGATRVYRGLNRAREDSSFCLSLVAAPQGLAGLLRLEVEPFPGQVVGQLLAEDLVGDDVIADVTNQVVGVDDASLEKQFLVCGIIHFN